MDKGCGLKAREARREAGIPRAGGAEPSTKGRSEEGSTKEGTPSLCCSLLSCAPASRGRWPPLGLKRVGSGQQDRFVPSPFLLSFSLHAYPHALIASVLIPHLALSLFLSHDFSGYHLSSFIMLVFPSAPSHTPLLALRSPIHLRPTTHTPDTHRFQSSIHDLSSPPLPFVTTTPLPPRINREYVLKFRQQPRQARMCGVGDKGEFTLFLPPIYTGRGLIPRPLAFISSSGPTAYRPSSRCPAHRRRQCPQHE